MAKVFEKGIDISHWQESADLTKVKSAGYNFVIIKLGSAYDSGLVLDGSFKKHYANAVKAGLKIGVYVYSYVTTEAASAACAKQTLAVLSGLTISYPVMFDIEFEKCYTNVAYKNKNTAIVTSFLSVIEESGYYAMLYCSKEFIRQFLNDSALCKYDKWIAQYSSKCTYPGTYGMWQFAVAGHRKYDIPKLGSVPGISGQCDVDYAYKDYAKIIKNKGLNGFKKLN